jgi:hypothetical protein
MYIKTYKVRYARTGEIFEKEFTEEQSPYVTPMAYISKVAALELVNEWNRQNATSGFTYWIE